MKTSVALLTFSLFYLCVAEVQQQDNQAGECKGTKIRNVEIAFACADDTTESQVSNCQPALILRELEAKPKNTEEQFEDVRGEVKSSPGARGVGIVGAVANDDPFLTEITLTYKNDLSEPEKYHISKGIFTAPVKGTYYLNFSGQYMPTTRMGLRLQKTGVQMETVVNKAAGSQQDTAAKGMILQLEEGEQVHMSLRRVRHHFGLHIRVHIRISVNINIF